VDDDWNQRPDRTCPRCGAPNWPDAVRCASCSAVMAQDDRAAEIIDVSTGQPRVVRADVDERGRDTLQTWRDTVRFDERRVIVTTTSGRNCLLAAVLFLLLGCCLCWALWNAGAAVDINWL
jgi:hypothetical protein